MAKIPEATVIFTVSTTLAKNCSALLSKGELYVKYMNSRTGKTKLYLYKATHLELFEV